MLKLPNATRSCFPQLLLSIAEAINRYTIPITDAANQADHSFANALLV